MTTVCYSDFYSEPQAMRAQSNAASSLGETLNELLIRAIEHARRNATDWRPHTNALIEGISRDCQVPNWDGYGARAIDTAAKEQAQRFVDLLPYRFPAPDPVPDPDGALALSWDFGPGSVFTISISGDGSLTYAGLLGGGVKRHGVERFDADIPEVVLRSIDELTERAAVRR